MRPASLLVRALVPLMVAAPLAVVGPAASASYPTHVSIRISPSSPVDYGTSVHVKGQVHYYADGDEHAAEGVVWLARRNLGTSTWSSVGSRTMAGFFPSFDFPVAATRNALFRLRYVGSDECSGSVEWITLRVARKISSSVSGRTLYGKVTPGYAHKPIALMRRTCAACSWHTISSGTTSAYSRYSFTLPRPPRGSAWYYRARVPSSTQFTTSYSSTWRYWVY